ncbi:MAG: hypothetical protein Q8L68_06385, partial [Methylococcales bacterium]|nr:hypothetical protein [Methylococcales bacterium]
YFYIYFYDSSGYQIFKSPDLKSYGNGFWELLRDSNTNQISLRIDGVSQGNIGTASSVPCYFRFEGYMGSAYQGGYISIVLDDISTTGNFIDIGTESPSHKVTEAAVHTTNVRFTIKSYPLAEYTASEYKIAWKRMVNGSFVDIINTTVKGAGNSTPFHGLANYNRGTDLTQSDTAYGLYYAFLTKSNASVSSDYFFLALPGDTSSINFTNNVIIIGQTESISYIIDSPDFTNYNYHVRVYSVTQQLFSQALASASGTVQWDSTGGMPGLVFAVLSRTHKTTGEYDELVYAIASLSENILVKGYTHDLQTGAVLGNVNVNILQGSTWYNTTSNSASGYYELKELLTGVNTSIYASKSGYSHDSFSFIPPEPKIYNINLWLLSNTPTYNGT